MAGVSFGGVLRRSRVVHRVSMLPCLVDFVVESLQFFWETCFCWEDGCLWGNWTIMVDWR